MSQSLSLSKNWAEANQCGKLVRTGNSRRPPNRHARETSLIGSMGRVRSRANDVRIAYGVHGYNLGHASRAACVIAELSKEHEVLVFAGGDAFEALSGIFPVHRVPSLQFVYRRSARISCARTLRVNAPLLWDLARRGPVVRGVEDALRRFGADVVISDAEAFTVRAASQCKLPRISFDHFGVLVHCRVALPWADRLKSTWVRMVYRFLYGGADRVLVSSFFPAEPSSSDVQVVGPLLRDEVFAVKPSDGKHLLVYVNRGSSEHYARHLENVARNLGRPVIVYGSSRRGRTGQVQYKGPSTQEFLCDVASSFAVLSTAGNQLVGEALFYGKALLVVPEPTVEQRLNAASVVRLGVGESVSLADLTLPRVRQFLERADAYGRVALRHASDGREAVRVCFRKWLPELVGSVRTAMPERVLEAAA
jgi:uncharacterized protein (TIGR00661 family)